MKIGLLLLLISSTAVFWWLWHRVSRQRFSEWPILEESKGIFSGTTPLSLWRYRLLLLSGVVSTTTLFLITASLVTPMDLEAARAVVFWVNLANFLILGVTEWAGRVIFYELLFDDICECSLGLCHTPAERKYVWFRMAAATSLFAAAGFSWITTI